MNLSEEKDIGLKGWLRGKAPKVKPQESKTGQVVLDKQRIAVLPFVNMSPDPSDEYFADGMTEETISTVSGISGFNVISRTSAMHYKKTEKTVKEIARELEVGSVLEGSFRKAGNKIRVTAQLIDVASDGHLWAQNYDRTLDDVFEVQSDIAKQVADALRVRILLPEKERLGKKPTESVEAHTLYLRGVYHLNKYTSSELDKAIEYLKLAYEQDPTFALAYARVGECYVLTSNQSMPSGEAASRAKEYVTRALSLDKGLAEAYYVQAMIASQLDWDWVKAEESFKRALALNPSLVAAHYHYGCFLAMMGRSKEAVSESATACELDPMSPTTLQMVGFNEWIAGEYERARAQLRRTLELAPDFAPAHLSLAELSATEGKFEEAVKEADEAVRLSNEAWLREGQAMVYAMSGLKKETMEILEGLLRKKYAGYVAASFVGAIYYLIEEKDKGWEWMQKAYEARDSALVIFNRASVMKTAREDPRFTELLRKMKMA
jgi:TolB-like protein